MSHVRPDPVLVCVHHSLVQHMPREVRHQALARSPAGPHHPLARPWPGPPTPFRDGFITSRHTDTPEPSAIPPPGLGYCVIDRLPVFEAGWVFWPWTVLGL